MDPPTKIMVVDNNPRARSALAAYISLQAGIQITAEAANGLEAIRQIQVFVPDIVFMDMQMAVMDGLEATRIIKKNWPQIKIIALTMYPDYQPEALSIGVDAFLVKSSSADEIIPAIRAVSACRTTNKQELSSGQPPQIA